MALNYYYILNDINMKRLTLLTLFICFAITKSFSQDFEGTILFEFTYMNLTEEMKKMLPEEPPQSIFSIKGTKLKMEMDMMGTEMVMISDVTTNTSTSYTDVMGQKIKTISKLDDGEEIEVILIDGETKRIAGYLCKKAIIKQADSPDVEVYYTEDLKSVAFSSMQSQFKKLKGIPLEYQVHNEGMSMITSAKEVIKKSIDNSIFNPPAGDYKEAPKTPGY